MSDRPHVVIIGGGFGGLNAARSLRRARVRITLIDRRNHHVFQPLLYQVATASLSPADISTPIRHFFSKQRNATILMAEAIGVDMDNRLVRLTDGQVGYDYLILAAGATHSYFGNDHWSPMAPGIKNIEDALEIRRRFLLAFEAAEREADPDARRAKLTFLVIGGGPTGVELAGAMAEVAHKALLCDFRSIEPTTARIMLIEGGDRVLPTFSPNLSARAQKDLERLGVEVRLGALVTNIDADGVCVGDEQIKSKNVVWAAGVQASALGRTLGVEVDRAGRVAVDADLSIEGHPEVFVIGDLAHVTDSCSNLPVPGVAPAAIQEAKHVAKLIEREVHTGQRPDVRASFCYTNKGSLATIGRDKAVVRTKRLEFAGWLAWIVWALVHASYLVGFRNRLIVLIQWAWAWVTYERGARLITGDTSMTLNTCSISSASESSSHNAPSATHGQSAPATDRDDVNASVHAV